MAQLATSGVKAQRKRKSSAASAHKSHWSLYVLVGANPKTFERRATFKAPKLYNCLFDSPQKPNSDVILDVTDLYN
eukprot:8840-Amphidinium_carterae.1